MTKFRKKPVIIEAIQLTEETVQECYDFIGAKGNFPECGMGIDPADGQFKITTLEGVHIVSIGDWIIKGVNGEFYPCKPNIFEATYDLVGKNSSSNRMDLKMLSNLLKYSDRYGIDIQFRPNQTAVYIYKNDVYLNSFGGDFDFAISKSIVYLNRITSTVNSIDSKNNFNKNET